MKRLIAVILIVAMLGVVSTALFKRSNYNFSVSPEQMSRDLDGRSVPLAYGQMWSFEPNQTIQVKINGKKQVDEFIVVVVEINAVAKIEQPKDEAPIEHSTRPSKADIPPLPKLPSKIDLSGFAKMTYEFVGNEWFLVNLENISLKATAIN